MKNPSRIRSAREVENDLTEEQRAEVNALFNAEVGFTKVIKTLKDAQKPIIGHNP